MLFFFTDDQCWIFISHLYEKEGKATGVSRWTTEQLSATRMSPPACDRVSVTAGRNRERAGRGSLRLGTPCYDAEGGTRRSSEAFRQLVLHSELDVH